MAQFIEIKIPKFDLNDLRKRFNVQAQRRARQNENLLLRTTQYFETVKPVFQSEIVKLEDNWEVITAPLDDESGRIWSYLDLGTSVRYAWMTKGYSPGTTPGTLETAPTSGQKVGLSLQSPADPIEARGWTELVAEREIENFAGEMGDQFKDWIRRWGGRASEIISG